MGWKWDTPTLATKRDEQAMASTSQSPMSNGRVMNFSEYYQWLSLQYPILFNIDVVEANNLDSLRV
jgi:hypothetical protein